MYALVSRLKMCFDTKKVCFESQGMREGGTGGSKQTLSKIHVPNILMCFPFPTAGASYIKSKEASAKEILKDINGYMVDEINVFSRC